MRRSSSSITVGGISYRSMLEARWCVFFSQLGIPAFYEDARVWLAYSGSYLADFELYGAKGDPRHKPSHLLARRVTLEVKPFCEEIAAGAIEESPYIGELRKPLELSFRYRRTVIVVFGSPHQNTALQFESGVLVRRGRYPGGMVHRCQGGWTDADVDLGRVGDDTDAPLPPESPMGRLARHLEYHIEDLADATGAAIAPAPPAPLAVVEPLPIERPALEVLPPVPAARSRPGANRVASVMRGFRRAPVG